MINGRGIDALSVTTPGDVGSFDGVYAVQRTLARRRVTLRALVVALGLLVMAPALSMPYTGWRGVAVWLFGPLLFEVYLIADVLLVGALRSDFIDAWRSRRINLAVFSAAAAGLANLPARSVATILADLPSLSPAADRDITYVGRLKLSAACERSWRRHRVITLARGLAVAAACACVPLHVIMRWSEATEIMFIAAALIAVPAENRLRLPGRKGDMRLRSLDATEHDGRVG